MNTATSLKNTVILRLPPKASSCADTSSVFAKKKSSSMSATKSKARFRLSNCAALTANCGFVFTVSSSGDEVTVINTTHPGRKVFIHVKNDATGERDDIKWHTTPYWWEFWSIEGTEPLDGGRADCFIR